MKNPSDFIKTRPHGSIFQSWQAETVALHIMRILARTGDTWRTLTWEEYQHQRLIDGNFSAKEKNYFERIIGYCSSEEKAKLFSPIWEEIANKN